MSTWLSLSNLRGYRTSPEFPIYLDGDGAIANISWVSSEPIGTKLWIETRLTFNDGFTWTDWKLCVNGGYIPDINSQTALQHAKIQFRAFLETNDKNTTPSLNEVVFFFEPVIYFSNDGDVKIRPEIWITKIGNGDFSIINTSNGNEEFKFIDLIDQETVYVNGEREQIETSLAATYRYANFNDNYLELPTGENVLRVIGDAKIQFRYRYRLLQG
ncbi:phage tail domain-containing protein [Paenibacillus naphthalenovorans]|uniref:Phage tail-like C-terminal domain-containing protein n=1 Tax=Paenibacillus naphthalenovorans TaxID=162209 RepID=A0A0U2MWL8_9BACL|nr:phage tail domain-containing protein [Paenibacillus naphthalenovorans]ALS22319.1 hypothetical protein IJ22_19450 [Paenibacillus naphthalenovorans]